jgi:thioredoxin reductase
VVLAKANGRKETSVAGTFGVGDISESTGRFNTKSFAHSSHVPIRTNLFLKTQLAWML